VGQIAHVLAALVTEGRWRRSLALAAAFAVGCGLLSWWQFARREETVQASALITANASAEPQALDRVLADRTAYRADQEWTQVRLTGTYLGADRLLVRNRVNDDDPGFEVLVPLRLPDGSVFVVDRGWVPVGTTQDRPDSLPPTPRGTVTVIARLQQDEGPLAGRTAPRGEIPSVDLKAVAKDVGLPTYTGAYGLARTESPAPSTVPLRLQPSTDVGTDEGTHLSYAIQWILFALLGFGGLAWSVRRDLRDAGDPVILEADERRSERRKDRAPSDESSEDALVDAR